MEANWATLQPAGASPATGDTLLVALEREPPKNGLKKRSHQPSLASSLCEGYSRQTRSTRSFMASWWAALEQGDPRVLSVSPVALFYSRCVSAQRDSSFDFSKVGKYWQSSYWFHYMCKLLLASWRPAEVQFPFLWMSGCALMGGQGMFTWTGNEWSLVCAWLWLSQYFPQIGRTGGKTIAVLSLDGFWKHRAVSYCFPDWLLAQGENAECQVSSLSAVLTWVRCRDVLCSVPSDAKHCTSLCPSKCCNNIRGVWLGLLVIINEFGMITWSCLLSPPCPVHQFQCCFQHLCSTWANRAACGAPGKLVCIAGCPSRKIHQI